MSVDAPLACPHCDRPLVADAHRFHCANSHNFDRAKGGYVNLAGQPLTTGDTKEMLQNRLYVQQAGVFDPLHSLLLDLTSPQLATYDYPVVVDVGAGTGHALAHVIDTHETAIGVACDASRNAAKMAQRAHPRIQAVVTDAWQPLPLSAGSVHVLMSVFAPRNATAFRRVIAHDGVVVLVSAAPTHLHQLRATYDLLTIDARKDERIVDAFTPAFTLGHTETLSWDFPCNPALAYAMIAMGPNAHHAPIAARDVTFNDTLTGAMTVHVLHPSV